MGLIYIDLSAGHAREITPSMKLLHWSLPCFGRSEVPPHMTSSCLRVLFNSGSAQTVHLHVYSRVSSSWSRIDTME